jgi:arabinofuranan 3-O-arabinosyltransferase
VNKGFKAVATPGAGAPAGSHSVDLGTSQLVDGFANGWPVTAADLHSLGGSSFTVQIVWTPQRKIWAALAISAATLLLCLALGFLPLRSRRWVRAHLPRRLRGPAGPEPPERPAVPFDAAVLAFPGAPAPKEQRRRGWLRFPRALVIGAVCGAAALLVTPPRAGLVVAVAVVLGLLIPWARVVASVTGIACIVAGSINVVQGQNVHHYLPGSNWDASFVKAGNLIWLGAALLLADGVISALGLRVPKPLRRSELRARQPGEWSPPEPAPVIIGIDG